GIRQCCHLQIFRLTFYRYIGGLAILIMLAEFRGGLLAYRSNQPWMHVARALTGCGAAVAITWSSANMPIIDATAIGLLYGVFALLLGAVILKENINKTHWLAVVVSLVGVATVMFGKGAFQHEFILFPSAIAFLGAVFFAIEGVLISVLGRSERALTVMLYVTFFGLCMMVPPALLEWQKTDWNSIILCLLLGPLGIFGQYCTIRGYRSAPLSVVGPVDYSWLLFAALLGFVFFNEVPKTTTWIGCAAILVGGILLARASKRE
ncbi:MAG: DMT family transporter, partial [Pseudomonadota bacterium]